jgi:hypothetical protein
MIKHLANNLSIKLNLILPIHYGFTHTSHFWSGYTTDNKIVEITKVKVDGENPLSLQDKNLSLKVTPIDIKDQTKELQRIVDCLIQALCKVDSCAYISKEQTNNVIVPGFSPVYQAGYETILDDKEIKKQPRNIMTITAGTPVEYLGKTFLHAYNQNCSLTTKEQTSYLLYSSSHFSLNTISSLLLLVSAFETISIQEKVGPKVLELLNTLFKEVDQSEITADEKTVLKNGIGLLKEESKNKGLQRLVSPYNSLNPISWSTESSDNYRRDPESIPHSSKDISDFIKYCYKIRSEIVHGDLGEIKLEELPGINSQLTHIYNRILSRNLVNFDYIH